MFRLKKWYLDCVTPDGNAVVAYWSQLVSGIVHLRHAARLLRHNGTVSEVATLRAGNEPRRSGDGLAWGNRVLGIRGHWQALCPPLEHPLLTTGRGNVIWHCLIPRARARLQLKDGSLLEGLGYIERLDITLPPWQLPIEELRWGRFLSQHSSLVWIEWRGSQPLKIVNLNGAELKESDIADEGVTWRDGRLDFEPGCILREGKLGATVLGRLPILKLLAPRAAKQIHESKRLQPARLTRGQGPMEAGWAIHEVVHLVGRRS